MAILLCDAELDTLNGIPSLPFRVYVQSLRPRMDIKTGLVGSVVRISYQAIKEDIYVEPAPGRVREPISTDQLFRAVRVLESVGLVRIRSKMAEKRLILECVLAVTHNNAQNKPATNPRLEAATTESSNGKDLDDINRELKNAEAATHRRSENIKVYKSSSSTREASITAPQRGGEETPLSIPPQGGACDPQGSTLTTEGASNDLFGDQSLINAFSEGQGVDFWPKPLNESQRGAIAVKLQAVEHSKRQIVVDELAWFMGRAGKPVENPVRYVDFIIEKAKHHIWFPEGAGNVRSARIAAFQQAKKREQEEAEFKKKIMVGEVSQGCPAPAAIQEFLTKAKRFAA